MKKMEGSLQDDNKPTEPPKPLLKLSRSQMERIITCNTLKGIGGSIRNARIMAQVIVADLIAWDEERKRAERLARNQAVLQDWRAGMERDAICAKHKIKKSTFYRVLKERHR